MNTCGPLFQKFRISGWRQWSQGVRVWAFWAQSPEQWHRSEAHEVGSAGICHGPRREGTGDLMVSPSKDFMVVRQKSQHSGKTSLKGGLQASPLDAFSRFSPSEAVGRLKPCSVFWVWLKLHALVRSGSFLQAVSMPVLQVIFTDLVSLAPEKSGFFSTQTARLLFTLEIKFFNTQISEPDSPHAHKSSQGPAQPGLHPAWAPAFAPADRQLGPFIPSFFLALHSHPRLLSLPTVFAFHLSQVIHLTPSCFYFMFSESSVLPSIPEPQVQTEMWCQSTEFHVPNKIAYFPPSYSPNIKLTHLKYFHQVKVSRLINGTRKNCCLFRERSDTSSSNCKQK